MRAAGPASAGARTIDRRALLAGAGAAMGAVAAGNLIVGRPGEPAPIAAVGEELRLIARDLRHAVPGVEPGELPPTDARAVPHGRLESPTGEHAGRLASAAVPESAGAVLHTFSLHDGSLLGLGTAGLAGRHAVVGGSGRYAGAVGTYTVRQDGDRHLFTIELR